MRMTNKIMQTNSLYNINQTKILEDKYNTQLTSQSKITRPSDDPVIAIRALRLRSNVSTVTQYNEKNASDADQWLDVTAQSLNTISSVLTSLYSQVQTGVNKDYTASDMEVLLTQIEAYTEEMYATGNQDYAGRYIFTGYRTDTALTMEKNTLKGADNLDNIDFVITEDIDSSKLGTFSYTDYSVFDDTTSSATATEQSITNTTLNRIRLSYNNLVEVTSAKANVTTVSVTEKDKTTGEEKTVDKSVGSPSIVVKDEKGYDITSTILGTIEYSDDADDAYEEMRKIEEANAKETDESKKTQKVIYVAETGEILMDSTTAQKLNDVLTNGGSISTTYEKKEWLDDDLNPVNFFDCTYTYTDSNSGKTESIRYNKGGDLNTEITYDVGYNQTIQVNTNAVEVFDPSISRDYADLKSIVQQYSEIEALRSKYQEELNDMEESDSNYQTVKNQYDAADKAYTYIRDAVSTRFSEQITRYQDYLDATNVAITKNGTRSTRLELIQSRLEDQQSTFKELQEDNEGIDMTEVAVQLTSAETTYNAALLATSKITQKSLVDYI